MKYRVTYAYPDGYYVEEKRLLRPWRVSVYEHRTHRAFRFQTIRDADAAISRLQVERKPVRRKT